MPLTYVSHRIAQLPVLILLFLRAEQMLSNRYPPYTPEAEKFFRATADVPIPASDPEKGLLSGV